MVQTGTGWLNGEPREDLPMSDNNRPGEPEKPASSQNEQPADLADEMGQTILDAPLDPALQAAAAAPAKEPAPRRGRTGQMRALAAEKAPAKQPEPSSESANDTVLLDARPRPGLAAEDSPTAGRSLVADDRPTAAKRPLADLVDDRGEESTGNVVPAESTVLGGKALGQRGLTFIAAGFMLLIGVGLGIKTLLSATRTPSRRDLVMLYPFGFSGGSTPAGRRAPGAAQVVFKLTGTADCGGDRCLTYLAVTRDGSFEYKMTVRDDDGLWKIASSGPTNR